MEIKLTKSDLYLIALFLIIAIPVTLGGYDYSEGYFKPVMDTIVYLISSLSLSYIIVYILFPKHFPNQQLIRLFIITALILMIAGILEILSYRAIENRSLADLPLKKLIPWLMKPSTWVWGISSSTQNAGILIGILLGKKFYEAQITIQEKEKEKRESELRLLKSQVDPHFLFNNLNTIDSLIDSNPTVAKTYLNKLSQLYRYLIRTKDDEVVPLEEELEFARNYIYLLEQRFGSAYAFGINKNCGIEDLLIPPGALQTLLENVVKHNLASTETPITTQIKISEDNILVSNNVNLKKTVKDSYGVGLNNLKSRYRLLSEKEIAIHQGSSFSVTLPNLKAIS